MCVTSHYHDTCSKTYYYESSRARVSPTQPDCRCGKIVERRTVSFEHHCKYCKDYLRWGGCGWKRELKEETWKTMYADLETKEDGEGEGAKMDWGEGKGDDEKVWLDWSDEKKGRSVGRQTTKGRSEGIGGRKGEGEDAKEEGDGFQAA